jgi:hypothetical protein
MDFNETLDKIDEAFISTLTLKNKAASGDIDAALKKKNLELNKRGRQATIDPKTGAVKITAFDKNTKVALDAINNLK